MRGWITRWVLGILLLSGLASLSAASVSAKELWRSEYDSLSEYSDEPYHRGEVYRVSVEDLRPTQFAVGMAEVKHRLKKIEEMDKHELRKYLKKKVGSVVIGPGEEFWIVDGHHLALALEKGGYDEMLVKVLADWSKLPLDEFYKRMIKTKRMWLYDENGQGPLDPRKLPKSLSGLRDDLYRSFAYKIEKAGGFEEQDVPFQEFMWANFFRDRIPEALVRSRPAAALKEGLRLAHSGEARELPGWSKSDVSACEAGLLH